MNLGRKNLGINRDIHMYIELNNRSNSYEVSSTWINIYLINIY